MLTFDSILALKAYSVAGIPLNESCNLLGYSQPTDGGGGFFYYNASTTEPDNGGSIIKPTSISGAGRWVRQFQQDGPVNVNWFGVFPNNVDSSAQLTKLIDYYKESATRKGVKVLFPKAAFPYNGAYVIKHILVQSGFTFTADQSPINNVNIFCPVVIKPASGATSLFNFSDDCQSASLENLCIDGKDTNGNLVTTLTAAINFSGKFNSLKNNNVINCSKHAVFCKHSLGDAIVGARIENNNFQGLAWSALTYPSYLGTLHIVTMGDSYIINNEIGGSNSSNYGVLKNPSRYATAMYANTLSTSVISGNIFENADIGVYWLNSVYNACSSNRYEYNGGGGLSMINVSLCVFTGERFTNNAMVRVSPSIPIYDDLTINEYCGNNSFIGILFANIAPTTPPVLPFGKAPRYHITNLRDNIQYYNRFVAPYFYLDPNNFHNCINQILPAIEPKIFDM